MGNSAALHEVRVQLWLNQTLAVLAVIVGAAWSAARLRLSIAWQNHKFMRRSGDSAEVKRSFEGEQSFRGEFRITQQIESMTTLMLSLGFVLLFGNICPTVVIPSLVLFMVKI